MRRGELEGDVRGKVVRLLGKRPDVVINSTISSSSSSSSSSLISDLLTDAKRLGELLALLSFRERDRGLFKCGEPEFLTGLWWEGLVDSWRDCWEGSGILSVSLSSSNMDSARTQ